MVRSSTFGPLHSLLGAHTSSKTQHHTDKRHDNQPVCAVCDCLTNTRTSTGDTNTEQMSLSSTRKHMKKQIEISFFKKNNEEMKKCVHVSAPCWACEKDKTIAATHNHSQYKACTGFRAHKGKKNAHDTTNHGREQKVPKNIPACIGEPSLDTDRFWRGKKHNRG